MKIIGCDLHARQQTIAMLDWGLAMNPQRSFLYEKGRILMHLGNNKAAHNCFEKSLKCVYNTSMLIPIPKEIELPTGRAIIENHAYTNCYREITIRGASL